MSSLYERWQPAVGDRVRVVERNETGAASLAGQSGTIVALHPDEPEALCEVRYDGGVGGSGGSGGSETHRHPAADLEPIGTKESQGGDWQPTVGDRVTTPGGREATVTAVEERPDGTACEVELNHRPGEAAEPQRRWYRLTDLAPTREPSAEALEPADRA